MNFWDLVALARVFLAFGIIFFLLPWLSCLWCRRQEHAAGVDVDRLVGAFVSASLFLQLSGLALGWLRLCLPGATVAAYLVWAAAAVLWRCRARLTSPSLGLQAGVLRLIRWLGTGERWRHFASFWKVRLARPPGSWMALLVLATLLQRLSYPLNNMHFRSAEAYQRAISLQMLTHGDSWELDGSVALLPLVVFLSGAGAVEVLRFSGPLFGTLLVAAVGWSVLRWTRQEATALLAAGSVALYPLLRQGGPPAGETSAASTALLYAVLAVGMLRVSRRLALASLVVALLVDWAFVPLAVELAACVAVAWLAAWAGARLGARLRKIAASALCTAFVVACIYTLDGPEKAGPLQYEAEARIATRIAREFPRNDWMVVATTQELPFTYGRGWHLELLEFVSAFNQDQVSRPDFRFPYPARHLFVFVEKRPLWPGQSSGEAERLKWLQPGPAMEGSVWAYGSPLGRATIQYDAAAIMATYCRSHAGASVYYEDPDLVVFHIDRESTQL